MKAAISVSSRPMKRFLVLVPSADRLPSTKDALDLATPLPVDSVTRGARRLSVEPRRLPAIDAGDMWTNGARADCRKMFDVRAVLAR